MRVLYHPLTVILALIVSIGLPACSINKNAGNLITSPASYPKIIDKSKKDNRYFIMHSGVDSFAITSILVEKGKQEFTVHLNKMDSLHRVNLNNPVNLSNKLIKLFMRDSTSYTLDEPHTIPLKKVARIELVN